MTGRRGRFEREVARLGFDANVLGIPLPDWLQVQTTPDGWNRLDDGFEWAIAPFVGPERPDLSDDALATGFAEAVLWVNHVTWGYYSQRGGTDRGWHLPAIHGKRAAPSPIGEEELNGLARFFLRTTARLVGEWAERRGADLPATEARRLRTWAAKQAHAMRSARAVRAVVRLARSDCADE